MNPIVLVTVSGKDAPGITSELTGVLAESQAIILDIGQAVIHGLLSLSILFKLDPSDSSKATIKDLLFKAAELDLKLDFKVFHEEDTHSPLLTSPHRYALTLISDAITGAALHEVSKILVDHHLNIQTIQRLSEKEFSCVELQLSANHPPQEKALKIELLSITQKLGVDIAFQAEGLFRRAKRLVVFDMDSTLIQNEVIDEFARELGVYEEVARITHEAMEGKIDFNESFIRRCKMLEGLTPKQIDQVYDRLEITLGVEDLFNILKKLGYKIALISGGFRSIASRLKTRLEIDYVYANELIFKDGSATGDVVYPIVNAQRKADLLEVIAQQEGITLDQVIAIGDGANDLLMLERAGLGIAFNAKPAVSEQADMALNQKNLRSVFYLLGISARDVAGALQ
jgi:phosphoserine phosphatase